MASCSAPVKYRACAAKSVSNRMNSSVKARKKSSMEFSGAGSAAADTSKARNVVVTRFMPCMIAQALARGLGWLARSFPHPHPDGNLVRQLQRQDPAGVAELFAHLLA